LSSEGAVSSASGDDFGLAGGLAGGSTEAGSFTITVATAFPSLVAAVPASAGLSFLSGSVAEDIPPKSALFTTSGGISPKFRPGRFSPPPGG
jgi:hypothetical protein